MLTLVFILYTMSTTGSPNILLVILDSVRAKNMGVYGHDNENTPFLSKFKKEATIFKQARSPGIHSIASHASIFSGTHVEEHGLKSHESHMDPSASIWKELVNDFNYATGIFTPNVVLTESSNLSSLFQYTVGPKRSVKTKLFEEGLTPIEIAENPSYIEYIKKSLKSEHTLKSILNGLGAKTILSRSSHDPKAEAADVYVNEFLDWSAEISKPWAACVNLMDAHSPYLPNEKYDLWGGEALRDFYNKIPGPMSETFINDRPIGQLSALTGLYDGCIYQLDQAMKHLISKLKDRGEFKNTLIVITSDHGEAFGEKSRLERDVRLIEHSWGIHEVLLHVPLIVKEPKQQSGDEIPRVSSLTQFPDVVRDTLRGEEKSAKSFVPKKEPVISSTFRIQPPGDSLPLDKNERDPYFGPWRAAYFEEGDKIAKYSSRRQNQCLLSKIINAQTSFDVSYSNGDKLNSIFEEIDEVNIEIGEAESRELTKDVEDQLAELGYLR